MKWRQHTLLRSGKGNAVWPHHKKFPTFVIKPTTRKMRKIEVCCTSLAEAHEAQAGGAVRIELCSALAAGGITPSAGTIAAVARDKSLAIDVNVLIRAREGSFLYTGEEVDIMVRDIELCRREGVHGVVIGALTAEGDIDIEACRRMVEAARGLSVTFHRAFDVCRDPHRALEQIIGLGCDRLLSSGQQPSAAEGAPLIAKLVEQAAARIIIMPGAGIRPDNIAAIEKTTRAAEFHSTARGPVTEDGMIYRNSRVTFAPDPSEEHLVRRTDRRVVSQLVNDVA